jgi:hypothetical protein
MSRTARRLLRIIGIVAYTLVFGELFLRVLLPQPLVPRYVTGSADGIRANMPDVAFRQWTPEVDVIVRYNDAGMRDDRPAPPLAKPPGECRVALLGDSYFVGFESDYAHSFAKHLEDDLRARGYRCRVLDFAVSGFGTAEMLIALQHRAVQYHPDIVLMSWHATDPDDNIRSNLFKLDDGGKLVATGEPFLPGIGVSDQLMRSGVYRWLIENSQLYSAVRERIAGLVKVLLVQARIAAARGGSAATPATSAPEEGVLPPADVRPGSPALDNALIFAVNDAARAAGAKFMVFDIPARRARDAFITMRDWLPKPVLFELSVVSPIEAFRASNPNAAPIYLEHGQFHWTARGNAIAAQVAANAIIAQDWLAPTAATTVGAGTPVADAARRLQPKDKPS